MALVSTPGWKSVPGDARAAILTMACCGSTRVIEDTNQRLRNTESQDSCHNRMSLQRCWFTPVQREVASAIHSYDEVQFTSVHPYSEHAKARTVGQ